MPVIPLHDVPIHQVPRIRTRIVTGGSTGAEQTTVWEQWLEPDGLIPRHYHEVEEVLVLLAGSVEVTLGEQAHIATAPASVQIPAGELHGLRPHGEAAVHLLAIFPTTRPQIFAADGSLRPYPWEDSHDYRRA